MSIAEKYFTDTAFIRIYKGISDRGDTSYEAEISVPCRFDYAQKEVLDAKGQKALSTATMLCGVFIPALSVVRNSLNNRFTVKSCEPVKRITGEIDHYEVML